ncbi:23S rRNA (uracil(1939)-C(5))-methyltransferase RlmD [Mycoplasma nasistruthionis]|uniref:23S rRNA (Uracil(1939)-C(5))-methyltransferase RlmD n=1 Tax=Mycoplasma nasistruthionis TaxID=353852 RepID=A0A5B7XV50_9MOLU|nr:23S rRNA (uracil(1939)-C(5))-methyltransferase RlmD [Mycoplasma nasistruthionis]QCZ36612.1 23S rRNA (uracil(1939)-C(5))-methyltransferase RlmD [Mycoplasma nasistruthionis]
MQKLKYQVGDSFEVQCNELTYQGYGAIRLENYSLFIKDLFPNEKALIKLDSVFNNYAFGSVIKHLTTSPNRNNTQFNCVDSAPLVNLNYKAQIEFKNQYFLNLLKRNLKNDFNYVDFQGSSKIFNYRNKVVYPLFIVRNKLQIGEIASKSHDLSIANNTIQNQKIINKIINQVLNLLNQQYKAFELKNFKQLTVRCNEKNQVILAIKTSDKFTFSPEFMDKLNQIESLIEFYQLKENKTNLLINKEPLIITLNDKKFMISIDGFFQINLNMASFIFKLISKYNLQFNTKYLIDAFCGAGVISQIINNNQIIVGNDIVQSSIDTAKLNAKLNKIDNTNYYQTDNFESFQQVIKDFSDVSLILDPPRAGIDQKSIDWILKNKPKYITYMSCDVKTLVRDLQKLEQSYKVQHIQGFDMFPNTPHIEALTIMELK